MCKALINQSVTNLVEYVSCDVIDPEYQNTKGIEIIAHGIYCFNLFIMVCIVMVYIVLTYSYK